MLQKMPKRVTAHHQATVGQLPEQSAQRQVRLLGDPRQNPTPFARHKVEGLWPPIFSAAGLPTARWRCDHFTTLATLTMNVLATERQDGPKPPPRPPAPADPKNRLATCMLASNPASSLMMWTPPHRPAAMMPIGPKRDGERLQ